MEEQNRFSGFLYQQNASEFVGGARYSPSQSEAFHAWKSKRYLGEDLPMFWGFSGLVYEALESSNEAFRGLVEDFDI